MTTVVSEGIPSDTFLEISIFATQLLLAIGQGYIPIFG
jgi:hypothetical protein